MIKIAAIVEGYGDVNSVPALISKTALLVGQNFVAPDPIRSGEWKSLRAVGELERYLELAHRRGWDRILIVMDLEDDCCATEYASATKRIQAWVNGRPIQVNIVFFVREYEVLFLEGISDIVNGAAPIPNASGFRDAKGKIKQVTGRRYRETQDQETYTKNLDLGKLARTSRCYRKLVKEVSGMSYGQIDAAFP